MGTWNRHLADCRIAEFINHPAANLFLVSLTTLPIHRLASTRFIIDIHICYVSKCLDAANNKCLRSVTVVRWIHVRQMRIEIASIDRCSPIGRRYTPTTVRSHVCKVR